MRIAIVGLNTGTAIYAQYLAKNGHEITVFTENRGDVEVMDLLPHALLDIVNKESIKLFTRKYLEDLLGISVVNTRLQSVMIKGNNVLLASSLDGQYHKDRYDRVVIGSELSIKEPGNCVSIYRTVLSQGYYLVNGNDIGKNTEILLFMADLGGYAVTNSPLAMDDDLIKSIPINRAGETKVCLTTNYEVVKPVIDTINEDNRFIGKGFTMRDSLSGADYVVNRDYQLIIMGKLLALKDLDIIDSLPLMPRLELGFSRDWSFLSIGLTRNELIPIFRDLSSSRIAYHSSDSDIIAKVIHRGNKLLSIQVLTRGVRLLNWFFSIYSMVMLNKVAYLVLDMGYERTFNTLRGLLEQLMLNLYNI
ncbi:hypothetical protein VMUT_1859 [Vulcanisaeta moutnovskia 768-28]|uniref:Uncharacterized protein n=1 Tax=Vulcanisaeta moutnovskia (strain 768-28) TaxID=985053 RepID=F0QVF8_VULM7|nr:hypothetical protein [Vulcanisaeta moutnovskia]ADY02060.1 hypothetical protein VMUT_1859 [Vulcanisaeta moutnovskia 768-28]